MKNLEVYVDELLISKTENNEIAQRIYRSLSLADVNDSDLEIIISNVLPKIFTLIKSNRVHKELVYLSTLLNKNENMLKAIMERDILSTVTLNMADPKLFFDYTIFNNRHWLLDALENDNLYEKSQLSTEVCNVIDIIKLINESNNRCNLNQIQNSLKLLDVDNNNFVNFYINEINRQIGIVNLCQTYPNSQRRDSFAEIYFYALDKSLLNIFIKFVNLQSYEACDNILFMLKELRADDELENFTAFCVIFNIFRCLQVCKTKSQTSLYSKKPDEITSVIKETELKLMSLTNLSLQVEVLENIFAFLFLQEKECNLQYDFNQEVCHFYCSEKEVRLLLLFLKSATDEIRRRNLYEKSSLEMKRFNDLNKLLVDALWRLELIADYEYKEPRKSKIETNIVNYMLSLPDSLINLCLKQNDFNKVQQVIKIFNMQNSTSAFEINYNTKLVKLKKQLKKLSKVQQLANRSQAPLADKITTIENFFKSNPVVEDENINLANSSLTHYSSENSIFMNIIDLAITQGESFKDCEDLLNIAITYNTVDSDMESYYSKFCKIILKIFTEANNKQTVSIREILCTPEFNLDTDKYKKCEEFYSELSLCYDLFNEQLQMSSTGKLNNKHISHKTFLKLQELTANLEQQEDQIKYFKRVLNYLRSFAKLLYVERNNSQIISKGRDTSLFTILNFSRSEILDRLIFEKKLNLLDFELLFTKLKLDLVYHITTIFFPKIKMKSNGSNCSRFVKPDHIPNDSIILYVQKRNWLLALILSSIYEIPTAALELNEMRVKSLIKFFHLHRIQNLKHIFDESSIVAALQHGICVHCIKTYFEKHTVKLDEVQINILNSQTSTSSFETAEEIFEGDLKITNWKHLFEVVDSVSQNELFKNHDLLDLRDMALNNLINDCFEPDYFKYVQFISNDVVRRECILNNLTTWPGSFCLEVIKSELSSFSGISEEHKEKFKTWFENIQLYKGIKEVLQKQSWFEVLSYSKSKPKEVFESLLNTNQVDLLLKFIDVHEITSNSLEFIDFNYFMALFDSNVELAKIEELFKKLPASHLIYICFNLLRTLKKLEYLDFVTNFIVDHNLDEGNIFKNIQLSLKMLTCFTAVEQDQLWCLITDPIAIIEVLIMNTKLDKLGQILTKIRPIIENCEFDENQLSVEKIDDMLLKYAEKSLEFRVVLQPRPRSKSPESSKLLQSLDSLTLYTGRKNFTMPSVVPQKSEWVQNSEVLECMCCLESTFSMFNRRHHCRRCGRVICGACSLKRMQVPTYGNIQVRVCLDCYEQSRRDGGSSSIKSDVSTRSIGWDYWLLTDDINHNHLVREEFSYEYAPSVSLCLAILKHHSKNENYPKFLLNQCDGMLRLLQPTNSEIAQEIDYLLVIKMLKSLALAAKMISAECLLQWGTSLADRILSQADLLGLLVERGCLHLITTCGQSQGRYIVAATLRRLRDKLLEMEQWNLALEVSTKAGLDNTGVFAAWGKSCLKAGCFQMAREKFHHCFEKTTYFDTSSELSGSFSSIQMPKMLSKSYTPMQENRPIKNPPLLNDVITILESSNCVINPNVYKDIKSANLMLTSICSINSSSTYSLQNDVALCILNKLKNLNSIAAGSYFIGDCNESAKSLNTTKFTLEPTFYDECIHYLSSYGTHLSLLEFYIKHDRLEHCLRHILDNRLSSDIFIEVYMLCLQKNAIITLHETMSKIDSTLDLWKDHLKSICRYLEKQSKLNSLYNLQQFMGDFVRAAMTCIKFYVDGASTFTGLHSRIDYLHKAQEHLQQEVEQEQWVEVATVPSTINSQSKFEAKGIANPSLVMKMDSKNVDKHINTIWRQIEITKFLSECEAEETPVLEILPEILPFISEDFKSDSFYKVKIPTLFGSYYERVQLAVLTIICGKNIADGFEIAFRIIQDYKLSPAKVYCQAGKQLAKTEKYESIANLVSCIRSSGVNDSVVTDMCDEMLILAVQTLAKGNENAGAVQFDSLIKLITDRSVKINAYIETKQLKSAYLLAAKHKRIGDIRRILREAEFLNQPNIKALCQKILHTHSHSKD